MLEVANISLEWQMEVVVFTNDGQPEVMLGCLRLQTSHEWHMEVVVFTNDGRPKVMADATGMVTWPRRWQWGR